MPTTQLHQTITATPEHILAGITDVGPGRSQLFPNSADDQLEVYDKSPDQADVTECGNELGAAPVRLSRVSRTQFSPSRGKEESHRAD